MTTEPISPWRTLSTRATESLRPIGALTKEVDKSLHSSINVVIRQAASRGRRFPHIEAAGVRLAH